MSALMTKNIVLLEGYGDTSQYRILENGKPVTDNLTAQNIKLYVVKPQDSAFVKIIKDVATESWVVDNNPQGKIIQIVIDTTAYLMTEGIYKAEVDWIEKKLCLVAMDISVKSSVKEEMI